MEARSIKWMNGTHNSAERVLRSIFGYTKPFNTTVRRIVHGVCHAGLNLGFSRLCWIKFRPMHVQPGIRHDVRTPEEMVHAKSQLFSMKLLEFSWRAR
jgi:hypothetical protein